MVSTFSEYCPVASCCKHMKILSSILGEITFQRRVTVIFFPRTLVHDVAVFKILCRIQYVNLSTHNWKILLDVSKIFVSTKRVIWCR
jgi:hypothetical protein